MNREIKFRAWYKKKMYNVSTLGLDIDGIRGSMTFAHPSENPNMSEEGCVMFNKNTPFMQYTGLKDKNGRDIYESDIVMAIKRNDGGVVTGMVAMIKSCWCVVQIAKSKPYHYAWSRRTANFSAFEIIGNIFENPELCGEHCDAVEEYEQDENLGGTGHGDISWSDADPGL